MTDPPQIARILNESGKRSPYSPTKTARTSYIHGCLETAGQDGVRVAATSGALRVEPREAVGHLGGS